MDVKSTWLPTLHRMDHVSWSLGLFSKPLLGGRPNTKRGDHGTLNAHNRWFILFYHLWGPAWIETHWTNVRLRIRSHMTSQYTWESRDHTTWCWRCVEMAFRRFLLALSISWSRSWLVCEVALWASCAIALIFKHAVTLGTWFFKI